MWMAVVITLFDAKTVQFTLGIDLNHGRSVRIADMRAEI
jgi:hypothetical protein